MEERLEHGDRLHAITNDVFQGILDLGPQLREFVIQAKQYHKALLSASVAASSFYQGFTKIAHLASETKASNKLLGKGICDVIAVHKQIENQVNNVLKAISQDFVVPLEDWIENNISQIKAKQKTYVQDSKNALELVEKARSDLTKVRKKSQRSKASVKYETKEQQITTAYEHYQTKLDKLRVSGCHEALRAQRNAFSFVIDKMNCVSQMDLAHHEKAFQLLSSRLPTWESLVRQPLSLEVNVSSLCRQLTENDVFDKSLDEHLSTAKVELRTPSSPPVDQTKHADKRLSHQFTVGSTMNHNGLTKDKDKENRSKVQAIYAHEAADSTQLSFEKGDIIKTLTNVTSGWQYGENTKTAKSGWFPVAFTEKYLGGVMASDVNPTRTLPISGPVHSRPSVLPKANGTIPKGQGQGKLIIPERDYGVPLKNVGKAVNNNHVILNHENSSGSTPTNDSTQGEPYFPPPPPPPPLPTLEEDIPATFPPPPPLPLPSSPESFDQAL